MADQTGSIAIDILRTNNAFPTSSIVGAGIKPNLSSLQWNTGQTPSGWTSTALVNDDWIAFSVTGTPSSVTQITCVLTCSRNT